MKLKSVVDSLDGLDDAFHQLYTEKDGKFLLTGVEGIKTQADLDRVTRAHNQEKEAHKKTKEKLAPLGDLLDDIDSTLAKLDEYDTLKAASAGKFDEGKLNELAEQKAAAKIKALMSPLERKLAATEAERDTFKAANGELTARDKRRIIHDAVRSAGVKSKILDTAMDDALMMAERVMDVDESGVVLTKENAGVTPGIDVTTWLTEVQPKRPHWWPASQGGGAKGSGGGGGFSNNPWTAEHWNMTEQGRILTENPTRAENMAKSAGTEIGGRKPALRK